MKITAYSLYEFCQLTQEAIKQGYEFDFVSNENFPQSYGSYLECTMVRKQPDPISPKIEKQEEVKVVVKARKNSID